ncbi:hypothetical protein BD779DRAFT_1682796 [Infundibulicybe gibba]|nr:hypothetical protein BD779DRAFT_1682796 [Infundibulicybe gibba]
MDFNSAKGLDPESLTPRLRNPDLLTVDRKKALPSEPPEKSWIKKRRVAVTVVAFLLLAGIIVGGVVGGLKAKNKKSNNTAGSQSSSADPTVVPPLASQSGASPTFLPRFFLDLARPARPLGMPPGEYAFRKTILAPAGKTPTRAVVLISVDDEFSLYHNGRFVATGANITESWELAVAAQVVLDPNGVNILAVRARNLPHPVTGGDNAAGLLASVQVDGFEAVGFDDSGWTAAIVIASYGAGPWNTTVVLPPEYLGNAAVRR